MMLPSLAAAWQQQLPEEGCVLFCNEASGRPATEGGTAWSHKGAALESSMGRPVDGMAPVG